MLVTRLFDGIEENFLGFENETFSVFWLDLVLSRTSVAPCARTGQLRSRAGQCLLFPCGESWHPISEGKLESLSNTQNRVLSGSMTPKCR